jgi:hypothetical protein
VTTVIEKQAAPAPTTTVVETVPAASHTTAPAAAPKPTPAPAAAPAKPRVPNLVGERLDVAENDVTAAGLTFKEVGGGAFGIVVRSNWTVCSTKPAAGKVAAGAISLIVARNC